MIEFGDHRLLVLEVPFVLVDKRVAFVDHAANVVEDSRVGVACALLEARQFVLEGLVLSLLAHELVVHVRNLPVVLVQLSHDHFVIHRPVSSVSL